jgi:hypothetical protein
MDILLLSEIEISAQFAARQIFGCKSNPAIKQGLDVCSRLVNLVLRIGRQRKARHPKNPFEVFILLPLSKQKPCLTCSCCAASRTLPEDF